VSFYHEFVTFFIRIQKVDQVWQIVSRQVDAVDARLKLDSFGIIVYSRNWKTIDVLAVGIGVERKATSHVNRRVSKSAMYVHLFHFSCDEIVFFSLYTQK
jgi:hypothetical protein